MTVKDKSKADPHRRETEGSNGGPLYRYALTWETLQEELQGACDRWDGLGYGGGGEYVSQEGWHGPSMAETLDRMRHGDRDMAREAEGLFAEALESCLEMETAGAPAREASPVGAYPNVPAFLAGRPDSMYGLGEVEGLGPIKIVVGIGCQAQVSHKTMLRRGTAIAALAYAMQTVRPVELHIGYLTRGEDKGQEHMVVSCPVGIAPLDLSMVSVAVAGTGIARRILRMGRNSVHDWGQFAKLTPTEAFDLGPNDLYFPNVIPSDADQIDKDPLGFILSQVRNQDDCQKSTYERAKANFW